MAQRQHAIVAHFNDGIWQALESVRLRQTPWHKKQVIFDKMKSLGLIEAIPQKTLTPSLLPLPLIAVLTDVGRQALAQRSGQKMAHARHAGG